MAFKDNNGTYTITAIITKKGRELLSSANGAKIVKFALSDDGVNYDLYDPDHPKGSDYYGAAIENMPLLESSIDESQNMQFLLTSLEKDTVTVTKIVDTPLTMDFKSGGTQSLKPQTNNFDKNTEFGYTLIIPDSRLFTVKEVGKVVAGATERAEKFVDIKGKPTSIVAVGQSFELTAKSQLSAKSVIATVKDNLSGATQDIVLNIAKVTFANNSGVIVAR